ncbi:VIT domain-containing protein [Trichothermofontia sp.]
MKTTYLLRSLVLLILGAVGLKAHLAAGTAYTLRVIQPTRTEITTMPTRTEAPERPVGGLWVQTKDGESQVFPLKHTHVNATISGNLSRVEVTQRFENPFNNPLEAVYVFPLPDEAAVDDMEIKIGDRVIKGDIKKREEAQQIYEQAKREGRTAGLLEQERENIFTQSLANIRPGEHIEVTIRYTDSLKFEGGDYEFVFPMVVGPRYIPGTPIAPDGDTDQVPDASRITPPVLKPGMRSGHDIAVTVAIDAGVPIQSVDSPSHSIQVQAEGRMVRVQLANEDTIPNKDLILRYKVAGRETQTTVLTQADDRGGHFAVYLIPALTYRSHEIVPKDVVFLMDTSGSQQGDPLVKSQELMRRFINGLNPNDTFTIIDFANTATQLSAQPLANNAANRAKAIAYIDQLQANGGTELMNGINAVLNFPPAPAGRLRSVVLLTDGYIGNDTEVIAAVQQRLPQGVRLYSFGVGSSVNRFLLDRLAEVGRGTLQVIRQDEASGPVAEKFFRQINNPVLTNIQVEWLGEGSKPMIYPLAAPDLFANQPLVLFGRKEDRQSGRLRIRGIAAGGERYEQVLDVNFGQRDQGGASGNPAIAQLWGRARIKELMNQMYSMETTSGVAAVTNTALAYRLLSPYTAFVAVSEEVRVDSDGTRRTVQVPVELPEGVSYEGIFGSADAEAVPLYEMGLGELYEMKLKEGTQAAAGQPAVSMPVAPPPTSAPLRDVGDAKTGATATDEAALNPDIQVLRADGLDAAAIADLNRHLLTLTIPANLTGDMTLELVIRNGHVSQVRLDDQQSTLKDAAFSQTLQQHLRRWSVPGTVTRNLVRLVVQVR